MMPARPNRPNKHLAARPRGPAAWLAVLLALWALLLAGVPAMAQPAAPAAVPALHARVTDSTGTLDSARRQALEQRLAALEQRKGAQVAVLVVPFVWPP